MSAPRDRRGFLRGLVSLPLIGGGLTLIGRPTGAAEPLTPALLDSYDAWLEYERRWLQWERTRTSPVDRLPAPYVTSWGVSFDMIPGQNEGARFHDRDAGPASSRAAIVLAAAGCDWRGRA